VDLVLELALGLWWWWWWWWWWKAAAQLPEEHQLRLLLQSQ
jgi:hypothetical protein